jgi:FAD:protein FMN transferase
MSDTIIYQRRNVVRPRRAMFLFVSAVLIAAILLSPGCAQKKAVEAAYQTTDVVSGLAVVMTVYGENAKKAVSLAQDEYRRIDSLANRFSSRSDVTNVNKFAGVAPVVISEDTMYMLRKALYYSELTGGAYDLTMGPLSDIWGVGLTSRLVPSDAKIASERKLVNYKLLELDEVQRTAYLPVSGMSLDISQVARGYGIDCAVKVLLENGITSGSIAAGNLAYSFGVKPDGPWKVVVPDPKAPVRIIASVPVNGSAAATAAEYQSVIEDKGIPYHSNLDARTGRPSSSGTSSATVIYSYCTDASVLSHGVLMLGKKEGEALLKKVPGAEAIFVDSANVVTTTAGIAAKIDRISK